MIIYTDGSCKKNKVGAYGFIKVIDDNINMAFSQRVEKTTNNRMELLAVYSALQYIKKNKAQNAVIYCDSKYVVDGYSSWMFKWENDNWQTSKNKEVLNKKIWEKFIILKKELNSLNLFPKVEWVKAHSSNKYNNYIDKIVQNLIT